MAETQMVFVVDDDQAFRESLVWLLEGAGYSCRAFDSAEAFLNAYRNEPGCLLLDIRMPGLSGLELQQHLNSIASVLPVILVTGHGNVSWAVEGMKNRAVDFIEKPFDDQVLLELIESTLQLSEQRFAAARRSERLFAQWQQLSRREKQVVELVAKGLTNKAIAKDLSISIKTVEVHRSRAMKKLECDNLAGFMDHYREIQRFLP